MLSYVKIVVSYTKIFKKNNLLYDNLYVLYLVLSMGPRKLLYRRYINSIVNF
jgi:hypothetical protein